MSSLNLCKSVRSVKQTHACVIVWNGHEMHSAVALKLISLYAHFDDFCSSVSILLSMRGPNSFLWNSVLQALLDSGLVESVLFVFRLMRERGVPCDGFTFPVLNKTVGLLESGSIYAEMIHCLAMKTGFALDVYFCNTMIDAYVKSDRFQIALKLFDEMPLKDSVSWTSLISGSVYTGNDADAFRLFSEMRKQAEPNEVTMIVMMQTCCDMFEGGQLHGFVIKSGFLTDQSLSNSILKMYADLGYDKDLETHFEETLTRDEVSWNTMISFYSFRGQAIKMSDCFNRMRGEVKLSARTLASLISGVSEPEILSQCRQIHCLVLKSGFIDDAVQRTLLNLYAKFGNAESFTQLFTDAKIFEFPCIQNLKSLVVACMHLGALLLGKVLHGYYIRNFIFDSSDDHLSFETSILNMYVRCGSISSAKICFDKMMVKDLVAWTSMIEGCGTHGLGSEAFELFHRMEGEKLEPNRVTLLSLLSACSHSGLLHEGCEVLNSMKQNLGVDPDLDHYTCIVDLLGRCGRIKEALSIGLKLIASPDSGIWAALLNAARVHEDRKVGKYAAEKLFELECKNAGYYTLLCNVNAGAEIWDEVEEVRNAMKEGNLTKLPGLSYVEVKGSFHGFVSGDRSHSASDELYKLVEYLSRNAME